MCKNDKKMVGITIKTTDCKEIFIEYDCTFCDMDSGGNHAYGCPYYTEKNGGQLK
jgi:hypothetical protein